MKESGHSIWRTAALAWAVSHLLVAIASVIGAAHGWDRTAPPTGPLDLAGFFGWDAEHYVHLARHGYGAVDEYAFFPALVGLLAPTAAISTGAAYAWGLLLCNVAALVGLGVWGVLASRWFDPATGRRTVWLLALAPWAYTASLLSTDWLYIAASGGCLLLAGTRARVRVVPLTLLTMLSAAIRPPGASTALAVLRRSPVAGLAGIATTVVVLAAFGLHAHDAGAFFHAQQHGWGVGSSIPGWALWDTATRLADGEWFLVSRVAALIVAVVGVWILARGWIDSPQGSLMRERAWMLLVAGSLPIAVALASNAVISLGRFTVTATPLYLAIAARCGEKRRTFVVLCTAFGAAQLILAAFVMSGVRAP